MFKKYLENFVYNDKEYSYYNLSKLSDDDRYLKLPYCIRILLESAVRNYDGFSFHESDVHNILDWKKNTADGKIMEVPFKPARVILQDFTGVPAVVDFAAMRNAVHRLNGDPKNINPHCPVDLVVDHSIQVDVARSADALERNEEIEFQRNLERFVFLKWGAKSLKNFQIIPPGSGIVHQVNLEYLARVVFNEGEDGILYPDSVVGTDSHTTMINGLGVVGWGVGGIEAESVMLGQNISMVLPQVVGFRLFGETKQTVTNTDVVLTITKQLRDIGVVGKFIEFFGEGAKTLSVADRSTISNMCPEFGATTAYFPPDFQTLKYLENTGRSKDKIEIIENYLKKTQLLANVEGAVVPDYSTVIELDLSNVVPSCSGPKRPHDRISVDEMASTFQKQLSNPIGFQGFGLTSERLNVGSVKFQYCDGKDYELSHGSVVIAAITSCTNTSNPSVMLAAGLLAKKAVQLGLNVAPYIKTSLSPGSGVVSEYLKNADVLSYLEQLGFNVVGYGCMTCIGNSGKLHDSVEKIIKDNELVVSGVLSGNRNFEGRIHPLTLANYLASPPLVVAYALSGRVTIDFEKEPIGKSTENKDIYLRDIWPTKSEIQEVINKNIVPELFRKVYETIKEGNKRWNELDVPDSIMYPWNNDSTYIRHPPFFQTMNSHVDSMKDIIDAQCLLVVGNSVTTDHISPAGVISTHSAAASYLKENKVAPTQFNSYGSRRGNHELMERGTFANIRLKNLLVEQSGPLSRHIPSNRIDNVFEIAQQYKNENVPIIIVAGKEYGSGSSRDWAAKGPWMLGVKAVIASSYERIHRSNLVGMGIIPLQFNEDDSLESLGIEKEAKFTIRLPKELKARQSIEIVANGKKFNGILRLDTQPEIEYFKNGGILNYVIRQLINKS
ncbi:hypothetical protein SNEBB_002582 [Seison nebaliae]|nr:hypothetical protein SNEBB_002582 [Seison nebaliae]